MRIYLYIKGVRNNDLFDAKDNIILHDLTNTVLKMRSMTFD